MLPNLSLDITIGKTNEYYMKNNFVSENTIYIHGEFNESIVELLPQIQKIIATQKTLINGKIIFDINSNGGFTSILFSLINLVERQKKKKLLLKQWCNALPSPADLCLLVVEQWGIVT